MAVRKRASLLLFVTLVAAVSLASAAAAADHPKGFHDRKRLYQSTERIEPRPAKTFFSKVGENSADYGPPVVNPPVHIDPPGSGLDSRHDSFYHFDESDTSSGDDIHTDYAQPGTHPPDDNHDYPPGWPGNGPPLDQAGAKMSAKTWNTVTSNMHAAPPPPTMEYHTDNLSGGFY